MASIGQPGDELSYWKMQTTNRPFVSLFLSEINLAHGAEIPMFFFGSRLTPYRRISNAYSEEESILDSLLLAQACYFPNPLPVELMPLEIFFSNEKTGIRISAVLDYPINTLVFESSHSINAFDIVSRIGSRLLELNIAYSLLVSDCGRKIYLFFQANFCSLSAWECGGYFLFNSQSEFDEVIEDSMYNLLSGASLDIKGVETGKHFAAISLFHIPSESRACPAILCLVKLSYFA